MSDTPPLSASSVVPAGSGNPSDTAGADATGAPDPAQPLFHEPTSSHAVVTPETRIGDYSVLQLIGEGGMGAVYLAEDTRLGRKVAIKRMRPELAANKVNRDRFVREARAAAALDSDHIVPILHIGETADGAPFIVMPFLQGEMLETRLKREPVAPVGLVVKVAREVAEGLAAAHASGHVHRDIKPSNIWLEGDPAAADPARQVRRCKILDFGLARPITTDGEDLTASGAVLGTPAYMAPEQARGERVDHRADLFSLGAMLYRMATGQKPFRGSSAIAVLFSLASDTPTPARELAPHLPPVLADLIDRLMAKNPDARPQSAEAVAALLRDHGGEWLAPAFVAPGPAAGLSGPTHTFGLPLPGVEPEPLSLADDEPPTGLHELPPRRRSRAWGWAGAISLVLVAFIPLGWWLVTTLQNDKPVAKPDAKPDAKPEPGTGPHSFPGDTADADRKAAEWVLSLGGRVKLNDEPKEITRDDELPKGSYRLTSVNLAGTAVADSGLTAFKDCRHLKELELSGTIVSDDGLRHLKECRSLERVNLIACIYLTENGAADLRRALPKCIVNHQPFVPKLPGFPVPMLPGFPSFPDIEPK